MVRLHLEVSQRQPSLDEAVFTLHDFEQIRRKYGHLTGSVRMDSFDERINWLETKPNALTLLSDVFILLELCSGPFRLRCWWS